MTTMRVEFIIETDGDPSEVLDLAIDLQASAVDFLQTCNYSASGSEDDVSVTEVSNGNV